LFRAAFRSVGIRATSMLHGLRATYGPLHTVIWFELRVTDVERAQAFYGEPFGWTFRPMAEYHPDSGPVDAGESGHHLSAVGQRSLTRAAPCRLVSDRVMARQIRQRGRLHTHQPVSNKWLTSRADALQPTRAQDAPRPRRSARPA
jgi:hypothetical protein